MVRFGPKNHRPSQNCVSFSITADGIDYLLANEDLLHNATKITPPDPTEPDIPF